MGTESIVENRREKKKKTKKTVMHRDDNRMVKRKSDKLETERKKKLEHKRLCLKCCSSIIGKLMFHKDGWVFNQPVDAVLLNIPDYFSVISKPMDLGTIKSKLERNTYRCADEFAADVRLTFSNAMRYNPPSHEVHQMAITLNRIFEMRWKVYNQQKFKSRSYNAFLSSFSTLSVSAPTLQVQHNDTAFLSSFSALSLSLQPSTTKLTTDNNT